MKTALFLACAATALGASAANAAIDIYVSQADDRVFTETIGSLNLPA